MPGGGSKPRTHCKRGHEFTPENTVVKTDGYRQCKACLRASSRARWAERYYEDAEFRDRTRRQKANAARKRYADPAYRERILKRQRDRKTSVAYAIWWRKYYEEVRCAPEYRERKREYLREYYEKQMSTPEGRWERRSKQIAANLDRKKREIEQKRTEAFTTPFGDLIRRELDRIGDDVYGTIPL